MALSTKMQNAQEKRRMWRKTRGQRYRSLPKIKSCSPFYNLIKEKQPMAHYSQQPKKLPWICGFLFCLCVHGRFVCVKRQRGVFHKEAKKHSIKDKKSSKVDKARQIWERKEKKN